MLDLGSGCGATAIAAQMSGASRILANDIDPGENFGFKSVLRLLCSLRINMIRCLVQGFTAVCVL